MSAEMWMSHARAMWAWLKATVGSSLLHVSLNVLGMLVPWRGRSAEGRSPWMGMLHALCLLDSCRHPSGQCKSHGQTQHQWDKKTYSTIVWEKWIGEGIVPIYWSALILQAQKCYPELGELCSKNNENDGGLAAIAMRKPLAYITSFKHNNHAW